jgi:hypothetical protein
MNITEEEADRWVTLNKDRHKWETSKMLSEFAKDKIQEVVQEIHSQCLDKNLTPEWIGFKSFL